MSELGKLYPDVLLEHHRAPRHASRLRAPTHAADGNNPLCGDRVSVTVAVAGGRLLDIGCEVKGCAICRAAGSLMAEAVVGRDLVEVDALLHRFLGAVAAPNDVAAPPMASGGGPAPTVVADAEWGELAVLLEARRFPNRRRCASLSWEVLERALARPNAG